MSQQIRFIISNITVTTHVYCSNVEQVIKYICVNVYECYLPILSKKLLFYVIKFHSRKICDIKIENKYFIGTYK